MTESFKPSAKPDPPENKSIVLPNGSLIDEENDKLRQKERVQEDQDLFPVIIKRTDETRRHPDDALQHSIEEGLEQIKRPALSLLLSAVAAGLIVGFSAMAVAVVLTIASQMQASAMISRIATAFVYPLGFVVCVLSGAQLFTEHTATAFYPVLDRKASFQQLFRLWGIVILGNLVGAGAWWLAILGHRSRSGPRWIYRNRLSFDGLFQFGLAGKCHTGWLVDGTRCMAGRFKSATVAKITVIYMVTFLIGIGGLHHSIAGSAEMFTALFLSSEFTLAMAARFVSIALVGNLIGGSCFVAVLNYAHIRHVNE